MFIFVLQKVIKAVIALNRFARLARDRREASEPKTLQPVAEKPCEMPDWKVKMEARINQGQTKAENLSNQTVIQPAHMRAVTNPDLASSDPVTSLSCSSGYESSGSAKSTATMDDLPSLVSGDEIDKMRNDTNDSVQFNRLEKCAENSNTAHDNVLIQHTSDSSDNLNNHELNSKHDQNIQRENDESIISSCEVTQQPNIDDVKQEDEDETLDKVSLCEGDEVYDFLSDDDVEVYSDAAYSRQTNNGRTCQDEPAQQTEGQHAAKDSQQERTDTEEQGDSYRSKNSLKEEIEESISTYNKRFSSESVEENPGGIRLNRRRSSLFDDISENSETNSMGRLRYRRSSGVETGDIRKLSNRCNSPRLSETSCHSSRSDIPRYDRSRKSSNTDTDSTRGSGYTPRSGRRVPSPATSYKRSSRNNSREPSIDQDRDDITPIGRRRYWSPSPVREFNSEEQRKMRISAICGDPYEPSPSYGRDSIERTIPLEIERSPPPPDTSHRFLPRHESASSIHSDSYFTTHSPLSDQTLIKKFTNAANDDDIYSIRLRSSPQRDTMYVVSRVGESPGRNSPGIRQARIAAIAAGSTESLDRFDRKRPPTTGFSTNRSFSSSSDIDRQARIAAVMGGSPGSLNSLPDLDDVRQSSRPSSRTNSDEARHKRIAAILAKKET